VDRGAADLSDIRAIAEALRASEARADVILARQAASGELWPSPPDAIPALSIGPFVATTHGLLVRGEPTMEDWAAYGRGLVRVAESVHFLLGDWLCYGERRWGESYAQAVEVTGFSASTLASDKWVAGSVPRANRDPELSWSHHREVAVLPPEEQAGWLARAKGESLTRVELRDAIREVGKPGTMFERLLGRLLDHLEAVLAQAEQPLDREPLEQARMLILGVVERQMKESDG